MTLPSRKIRRAGERYFINGYPNRRKECPASHFVKGNYRRDQSFMLFRVVSWIVFSAADIQLFCACYLKARRS